MRRTTSSTANRSTRITLACSAALLMAAQAASAGSFGYSSFTGDENSGISTALTYTAKADFGGPGDRSVNGVSFTDTGLAGAGYSLNGPTNGFGGFGTNVTGSSGAMLSDFFYTVSATGDASLTLTGLTVGQQYVTTWYNAAFGAAGGRIVNITPSDTGVPFQYDENYTGAGNGNVLHYSFTATDTSMTYDLLPASAGDSFHHYALTNAVASPLAPVALITRASTDAGPYSPFVVSNDDLLQTSLLDATSTGGNFGEEGAGGIAILTNGTFTITGGNPTDNSQLATGHDGSSVTFNLDTSTNTLGYDVSSIDGYGGWNDGGRDRQLYSVYYSLVGSPDFVFLGSVDDNPTNVSGPSAIKAVFSTALSGVDAIRIDFLPGQENGYAGYGEFDVIGAATVPEPASLSLLGLGTLALLRRRRAGR